MRKRKNNTHFKIYLMKFISCGETINDSLRMMGTEAEQSLGKVLRPCLAPSHFCFIFLSSAETTSLFPINWALGKLVRLNLQPDKFKELKTTTQAQEFNFYLLFGITVLTTSSVFSNKQLSP